MTKKIIVLSCLAFLFSCKNNSESKPAEVKSKPELKVSVPSFNSDSAFSYVKTQVDFGPRIPASKAHENCANYYVNFFKKLNINVETQIFKTRTFDGKIYTGKNIIASINPTSTKRVLLCSHWDSRPFADNDSDPKNFYTPIDGANDGASGVGVLMEIARQMSIEKPKIGIDIVLLDLEDYGEHQKIERNSNSEKTWCLGTQYWAKNAQITGYNANFGILLDMVGAKNAVFGKEYYSKTYASGIVDKVWNAANNIGYGNYFKDQDGGVILDDHYFINEIANIPTIDIIHYDPELKTGFFPYWHTVGDKLDKIDTATLKAVGQTLLQVIYTEK